MPGQVTIKLSDGKDYTLRLMGREVLELRQKHGVDILSKKGVETIDSSNIHEVALLAMRKTHPEVTLDYLLENTDSNDANELCIGMAALISNKPIEEIRFVAENPAKAKAQRMQEELEAIRPLREATEKLKAVTDGTTPDKVQ